MVRGNLAGTDAYARDYLGISKADDLAKAIIEAGAGSKARLFVAQMQDYLGLGGEARMNEPGTPAGKLALADAPGTGERRAGTGNLPFDTGYKTRIIRNIMQPAPSARRRGLIVLNLDRRVKVWRVCMNNEVERIVQQTEALLRLRHEETLQETTPQRLHECLGEVVMMQINDSWVKTKKRQTAGRRAFYFSAEYLVGRLVYSNLFNLGILDEVRKAFQERASTLRASRRSRTRRWVTAV